MSEFNDVECPTCGHSYGFHAWKEMQQQREELETARHVRDFAKLTREVHKRQQAEMPKPTIDDLLKWLDCESDFKYSDGAIRTEIRAILEQHRDWNPTPDLCPECGTFLWRKEELEIIRAFVERVKARHSTTMVGSLCGAIDAELAAMTGETNG